MKRAACLPVLSSLALLYGCGGGEEVNSAAVADSLSTLSGVCGDGRPDAEVTGATEALLKEADKGLDAEWTTAADTKRTMRSALEGAAATTSCEPDVSTRFAEALK